MPRVPMIDFRGGVNTSFTVERLQPNELRYARNGHLRGPYGAVTKRNGTQRYQNTALGSAIVTAGTMFRYSGNKTVVVLADGDLHHKTDAATNFTTVTGSALSSSARASFATYTVSGNETLYIADGGYHKWTGTTLTESVADAPDLTFIRVYKSRMFGVGTDGWLYWSSIADPDDFDTVSPSTGGLAQVDTYDDEPLVALATVGSSLLLFKRNNVARFTGVSRDNIRIDTDSQGVSREVGCVAPGTIVEFDQFCFFLSDRGPFVATEASVQDIGSVLDPEWESINRAAIQNAVAVHSRETKEIILFVPTGSSTTNDTAWVYCYDDQVQAWSGPWDFSGQFDAASAWKYESADGRENWMVGGYDGIVRVGMAPDAVLGLDDVARAGTGGTAITLDVRWESVFGDPGTVKLGTYPMEMAADLGAGGSVVVTYSGDLSPTQSVTVTSTGAGVRSYRSRGSWRGRRLGWRFVHSGSALASLHSIMPDVEYGRRVS